MALQNILADFAANTGIALSNPSERDYAIQRINDAAEEIYMAQDLVGCLREQVFAWDLTMNQVALPPYVHSVRGMKFWRANINVTLQDMRPRFGNLSRWTNSLQWRLKGVTPLSRDISNASVLSFSTDIADDNVGVLITVVGRTPNSKQCRETVTLAAGTTEVKTTNTFIEVISIKKSAATQFDISVKDVEGNELAIIYNHELSARYTLYQMKEGYNPGLYATTYTQFLEVLYKTRFTPFSDNADEFPCPNYDKAIYWKTMEHFYLQTGKTEDATLANTKCNTVIVNVAKDSEEFLDMQIQFAPKGLYSIFDTFRGRMGYYQIPGDFRLQ